VHFKMMISVIKDAFHEHLGNRNYEVMAHDIARDHYNSCNDNFIDKPHWGVQDK
jgi:hypothetical protein